MVHSQLLMHRINYKFMRWSKTYIFYITFLILELSLKNHCKLKIYLLLHCWDMSTSDTLLIYAK